MYRPRSLARILWARQGLAQGRTCYQDSPQFIKRHPFLLSICGSHGQTQVTSAALERDGESFVLLKKLFRGVDERSPAVLWAGTRGLLTEELHVVTWPGNSKVQKKTLKSEGELVNGNLLMSCSADCHVVLTLDHPDADVLGLLGGLRRQRCGCGTAVRVHPC